MTQHQHELTDVLSGFLSSPSFFSARKSRIPAAMVNNVLQGLLGGKRSSEGIATSRTNFVSQRTHLHQRCFQRLNLMKIVAFE